MDKMQVFRPILQEWEGAKLQLMKTLEISF